MKPFDLEAAKRGEKIVIARDGDPVVPIHFVGMAEDGYFVVCQSHKSQHIFKVDPLLLAMAPKKKKTWYCRLWVDGTGEPHMACFDSSAIKYSDRIRWHGEPFTIEVGE